jgi:trimeric autotransporter adhesin
MAISTNGVILTRLTGALYNQQLGAATYAEVLAGNSTAAALNTWANAAVAADFGSKTDLQVATTLITNVGLSSVAGLANWVAAQLTAGGTAKRGETIISLLNNYSNMDTTEAIYGASVATFNTKVDASQTLSQTTGSTGGTFASVSSAVVNTALTLTSATQTSTGTAGDDTFTAAAGAWGTGDVVNGGAGTDTLNATVTGTGPTQSATSLVGVEVLNLTPSPNPVTLDLTGVAGLTQVNNLNPANGASLAVTGLGNAVNTTITGGNTTTSVAYTTAVTAATALTDAATLTLNGVNAGSTFTTAGIETLTVNSATAANTLTTLTDTGITRLNITGSQALTVSNAVGGTTIATVDASASTGAITLTTGNGAGGTAATGVTFTAGSGATTITTGTANDTVTLGAGASTVSTLGGNDAITSGGGANTITPGGGNDTLTLGAGVDTVRFAEAGATSSDVINGFATGDLISLNLGTAAVAATSTAAATAATAAFMGVIQTGTTTPGFAGVAGTGSASTISFQAVTPNATVANTVLPASNVLALNGVLTDGTASGLVNALGTTATGVAISTAANARFVIVAYTAGNVAQLWQYAGDGVGATQNGSTAAVDARIQSAELNLIATLNNVAPNSLTAASFNTYLGTSTLAPTVSNTGQVISLTGTLNTVSTTTNAQGQFMTAANDTVSVGLGTTPSAAATASTGLTVLDSSTTDSDTLSATVLAPGWNLGSTFTNLENINLTMTVADTDGWAMTTVMPGTTNLGVLGAQNVGTLGASGAASSTGITGIVSGTGFTLGAGYTGTLVASNATVLAAATLNLAGTAGTTAATSPTFNAVTPTANANAITALTVNVQANTSLNADSQTAVTPHIYKRIQRW